MCKAEKPIIFHLNSLKAEKVHKCSGAVGLTLLRKESQITHSKKEKSKKNEQTNKQQKYELCEKSIFKNIDNAFISHT